MIQLWPHQQQSNDLPRKALASGKRKPMLQVPTGGGKTRTAGAIVELMRQRDKRTVFIVAAISQIGRAHVCTTVTNAHLVFRLLLEKENNHYTTHTQHTT